MIKPDKGWNWGNIQASHNEERRRLANMVDIDTAETLINAVAEELVRSGGQDGWFQTFANSVYYTGEIACLHANLEKGLHQSEGQVFDTTAHLTLRANYKAFHLYIRVIQPSLTDRTYGLQVTGLSYMSGNSRVDYSASQLSNMIDLVKVSPRKK